METKNIILTISVLAVISTLTGIIVFSEKKIESKLSYVSSTEYIAGDEGQVIVRLTDFSGQPITIATCTDNIQYPNKTIFLTQTMTLDTQFSNYYHNFTVPTKEGVYTSNVVCSYAGKNVTASKTFHISLLNSVMQQRFSALNVTITEQHLQELSKLDNITYNLTQEITQNRNKIQSAQTNLSQQINTVSNQLQQNITEVINLINNLNQSQTTNKNELLNILAFINQTTYTTQTTITQFQQDTTQNFQKINNTLIGVKNDTETIIDLINNITTNNNITLSNLQQQISNLTSIVVSNQNTTQTNLSQIISLINQLNQTTTTGFDTLQNLFLNFNLTLNQKLNWITNITNLTEQEVKLLLIYHNISFNTINIYTESNNCWVGGQWVIFAQIKDSFQNTLTNQEVQCNITTTNWGNSTMYWDTTRNKFKYTHICDTAGTITWTIQCSQI